MTISDVLNLDCCIINDNQVSVSCSDVATSLGSVSMPEFIDLDELVSNLKKLRSELKQNGHKMIVQRGAYQSLVDAKEEYQEFYNEYSSLYQKFKSLVQNKVNKGFTTFSAEHDKDLVEIYDVRNKLYSMNNRSTILSKVNDAYHAYDQIENYHFSKNSTVTFNYYSINR